MTSSFTPATVQDIDNIMKAAANDFAVYRKTAPFQRADFLESIAVEIEALGDSLILKAAEETNLPLPRLMGERQRATMQLRSFAAMLREGSWVEASIDTAIPGRTPVPKPDIRKMCIPLGPVIVFGASNFPFAFSTAGGDTASALAAGCPVVVKAHEAHSATSSMVYEAIKRSIAACKMPEAVCQHVFGSYETGKALVQHPHTAAVGFTGSFTGGKALYDYAQQRKSPIPVFSEMGSVNPVVFLPDTLRQNGLSLAKAFAGSVTLSMGQFCTSPGVMFGVESEALDDFLVQLNTEVKQVSPARMLNKTIWKTYKERMQNALGQHGVQQYEPAAEAGELEATPSVASVTGEVFLENHILQEEVFGPFSLLVKCRDMNELKNSWKVVSGQLTTSLMGTENDFREHSDLVTMAAEIAGRVVFNNVPTGVEVCPSMVHGGPFPATTDSRFTSVGIQSVKRWVRSVCYQNCPQSLLPRELADSNPLHIWRLLNNEWTKDAVT